VADREHVTLAIRAQPTKFPAVSLIGSSDLGHLRWTVDDQTDLAFVRAVVERLGRRRYTARLQDILDAVRARPSLATFGGVRRG
jgi:spore coat polysaccharide biosynthesis protein SpsF (cytidylyltransferase family)